MYANALLLTPAARAVLQGGDVSTPKDLVQLLAEATRVPDPEDIPATPADNDNTNGAEPEAQHYDHD
jgi:hypothetical protein